MKTRFKVTGVLVLVATVVTLAVVVPNSDAGRKRAVNSRPVVHHNPTPRALKQHFAVFRRAHAASDAALPAQLRNDINVQFPALELNADLAQFVSPKPGFGVWVVPGGKGVCMFWQATQDHGLSMTDGGCATTAHVLDGSLLGVDTITPGGDRTLLGLAPDGNGTVTATLDNGGAESVPVTSNVYVVGASGSSFDSLRVKAADGAISTVPVP